MSDIKKIRVDEVDYDIKDLMARSGVTYVESSSASPVYLRDLTTGVYVLKGSYIYPFSGASAITLANRLVSVYKASSYSHVTAIYPYKNQVQYLYITNSTIEQTDISLTDLQNDLLKKAEITYGTDDMIAGETALETGKFYFVYESGETV